MRLMPVLTSSKGQGTLLIVSVALITSFLAGAVAFNQVRLIPDAFELRTNDMDVMTKAEVRGKNTATNFLPQAAWYSLSDITYTVGQNYGIGPDVSGDSYDGYVGSGGDLYAKEIHDQYYTEVEQRLEEQFDGYGGNQLRYEDCTVEIDSDIDVQYDTDQVNPIVSSADGEGLVTVTCDKNGLDITYKSDQSEYEIQMNNNRFPQLLSVMAAGAFEQGNNENGVEQLADKIERDEGRYDGSWIGGHTGYWDKGLNGGSYCKESKSDAKDAAEQDVQNTIDSRINSILNRFSNKPETAMDNQMGGSRICFFGHCTPELPGNINWDGIGYDSTVVSHSVTQNIDGSASEVCCGYGYDEDGDYVCNDYGWDGDASGKYYLDEVEVRVKTWEKIGDGTNPENPLASSNKIPTDYDNDGTVEWKKITVQEKIYHDFAEPGGY